MKTEGTGAWPHTGGAAVKDPPANAGNAGGTGSIPGSGRSLGGGDDYPLRYACLENPTDRGAWGPPVRGVTELDTTKQLSAHPRHFPITKSRTCWPPRPPEQFLRRVSNAVSWAAVSFCPK